MAVDAILNIYMNVAAGLTVYEKVIRRRVMEKLPFMATENVLMESVRRGGDRQALHEVIRVHSHAAAWRVKMEDGKNDLIERLANDPAIPLTEEEILAQFDPQSYIGRAPSQVTAFLKNTVAPAIAPYADAAYKSELSV